MITKRLLPFIFASTLPLSAFAQSSPAPSPTVGGPSAPRSSGDQPASTLPAVLPAPDAAELTKLLKDFLDGASRNDVAAHDRLWADDLIYTRAAGSRKSKAEIMNEVRGEPHPKRGEEETIYTAEDIKIQQYGTTAIVAFRLVSTTRKGDKPEVANYLNTGTFLKREGKWQAVSWQATKMAAPSEATK